MPSANTWAASISSTTCIGCESISERRGSDVVFATPTGPFLVRLKSVSGAPMRLTCHAAFEETRREWRVLGIERDPPDAAL